MSEAVGDELEFGGFALPQEGPGDPRPIIARLVDQAEEFADLRTGEPVIMVLFRLEQKRKGGKVILGEMCLPQWQGRLAAVAWWMLVKISGGSPPDYILLLDNDWWSEASDREREALIHHELMHCMIGLDKEGDQRFDDEGNPVWDIRAHDLEEFNATVRRYGAWLGDIREFMEALREGGVN